jgi:hypothetical protein
LPIPSTLGHTPRHSLPEKAIADAWAIPLGPPNSAHRASRTLSLKTLGCAFASLAVSCIITPHHCPLARFAPPDPIRGPRGHHSPARTRSRATSGDHLQDSGETTPKVRGDSALSLFFSLLSFALPRSSWDLALYYRSLAKSLFLVRFISNGIQLRARSTDRSGGEI